MKLSHYPSLELCKKLTEAKFPKTELKTREEDPICKKCNLPSPGKRNCSCEYDKKIWEYDLVFPSVMELLDEIPNSIEHDGHLTINKESCWFERPYGDMHNMPEPFEGTLPNALAECWLWLNKNGYLTTNNS